MSSKVRRLYADGGFYEDERLVKWAFVVVDGDEEIHRETGETPYSGGRSSNVENAEIEALYRAAEWAYSHPGNYVLVSDSKSVLDKLTDRVPNATRHPYVNGIKSIMKATNDGPYPTSLTLKFQKRRSDEWMELVDDLCEKK